MEMSGLEPAQEAGQEDRGSESNRAAAGARTERGDKDSTGALAEGRCDDHADRHMVADADNCL